MISRRSLSPYLLKWGENVEMEAKSTPIANIYKTGHFPGFEQALR
jgi:hypothetical protein